MTGRPRIASSPGSTSGRIGAEPQVKSRTLRQRRAASGNSGRSRKAVVDRRDGHEDRAPADDLQRAARVEGVFQTHAAARQQAEVGGEGQAVDVEQRQDVDRSTSSGVMRQQARGGACRLAARLACVWTTPLGQPVVPEL